MSESAVEQGLKPINEYQEAFEEFTSKFEELEEKLHEDLPKFSNALEVSEHIENDKVIDIIKVIMKGTDHLHHLNLVF